MNSDTPQSERSKIARKAAKTRKVNAQKAVRTNAAYKAHETRRANAEAKRQARSDAAKEAWVTIRKRYGKDAGTKMAKKAHRTRKAAPQQFKSGNRCAETAKTVAENKKALIEMAKAGEARPSACTTLGDLLRQKAGAFDAKFNKTIRNLAPAWFVNTSADAKNGLVATAKRGDKKPTGKTKEGAALRRFVSKTSECYDPQFDKTIRKIAPNWF